jgi:tripeptide aminopeptidase
LARVKYPRAELSVELQETYKNMRPFLLAQAPSAISRALEAAQDLGIAARETSVRGGTDGARLSELGLPTPNLFTGGYDYHSRFEWNTVQNLECATNYLGALLTRWAGTSASQPDS